MAARTVAERAAFVLPRGEIARLEERVFAVLLNEGPGVGGDRVATCGALAKPIEKHLIDPAASKTRSLPSDDETMKIYLGDSRRCDFPQ